MTVRALQAGLVGVALVSVVVACSSTSPPSTSGAAGTDAAGTAAAGTAGGSSAAGTAGVTGAAGTTITGGTAGTGNAAGTTGAAGTGAAGVSADAGVDSSTDAASAHDGPVLTGTVKIMVLGSSNEVITCWRALLWQKLRAAGVTNFEFVGAQQDGPDCGVAGYDKHDESHSGLVITGLPASTFLAEFKAHPPQIVLQHFGGADILANMPEGGVIEAYTTAVTQARLVTPDVIYLAAQHTPEIETGCNDCIANTMKLNAAMVPWAAQTTTAQSPVTLVDLFTGLDTTTDFVDGVHLNMTGSDKVASRWLAALLPILKP
jgi:acyl-CoA thioesterase I